MKELEKIIKGCKAGKRKAQSELYRRFAPKMFRVCLRYSNSISEAEDNLHDGFMRVFDKIDKYANKGSFEGWMRRVIVNVCLIKYRNKLAVLPLNDMPIADNGWLEEGEVSKISEGQLLELVDQLPPHYRMAFNLYVVEEMSHKEIARELGISEGTSKSNLSRARAIMKEKVKDYYEKKIKIS